MSTLVASAKRHGILDRLFWGLIWATIFIAGYAVACASSDLPESGNAEVFKSATLPRETVPDYHDNAWWLGSERFDLYCPEEDSCMIQWVSGDNPGWWVYKPL